MIHRGLSLACTAFLLLSSHAVQAATEEEASAAKETYIENIRLAGTSDIAAELADALHARGVKLAYVEQDTNPGGGKYFCGALAAPARAQILDAAAKAYALLPEAAWKKIGLKYVLLCSEARANDQAIGGIPVPPIHLLMLSSGGSAASLQHLALHEVYHFIEFQLHSYEDTQWNAKFSGYAESYEGRMKQSAIGEGKPGFINAYSETMATEDRAELFAFVLLQLGEVTAHLAKTQDAVLAAKLAYIKDKMQTALGMDIIEIGAHHGAK